MGAALITLQQARDQLQIEGFTDDDSQLMLRIEEATDIVVNYLKRPDHGWTDRTVPARVRAATLLVLKSLYDRAGEEPLSKNVCGLLARDRDPAMA